MVCVVILRLRLGRRNTAKRCQQALLIEPGDPFECRHSNILEATPRSVPMDHFGLEDADDRLDERVIIRVADAVDGGRGAAARRPVYRMETYCDPQSEQTTRSPSS